MQLHEGLLHPASPDNPKTASLMAARPACGHFKGIDARQASCHLSCIQWVFRIVFSALRGSFSKRRRFGGANREKNNVGFHRQSRSRLSNHSGAAEILITGLDVVQSPMVLNEV
jgi:hypothetical protein